MSLRPCGPAAAPGTVPTQCPRRGGSAARLLRDAPPSGAPPAGVPAPRSRGGGRPLGSGAGLGGGERGAAGASEMPPRAPGPQAACRQRQRHRGGRHHALA